MTLRESILRSELRRLGNSVAQLAETLEQAEGFPTDTAKDLCKIIREITQLIATHADAAPADKLLHVHFLLVQFAEHLRYPDRSRIEQTPWSIVQAIEEFFQGHVRVPCKFIIRPQWNYNYGLQGGFIKAYSREIKALSSWLPIKELKKKLGNALKENIYVISFPRIEKMNVLAHVNWGHEIGHVLASEWLDSHFPDLWNSQKGSIRKRIRDDFVKNLPTNVNKTRLSQEVSEFVKKAMHLAKSGIKELICDAIGVHLFGPATLASLAEFSCHRIMDANPLQSAGGYPPWRYRLRMVAETVVPSFCDLKKRGWHPKLKKYAGWIEEWSEAVKLDQDKQILAADPRTREAYDLIEANWQVIWAEVLNQLPDEVKASYQIATHYRVIGELIERLDHGIPPNEVGVWPETKPAAIADIWNAAWACKVDKFRSNAGPDLDDYLSTLFQLTLKAIESSYVQRSFGPGLRALELV